MKATYGPATARAKLFDYQIDKYGNLEQADEDGRTVFGKTFTSANRIMGFAYDARGNLASETGSTSTSGTR